MALEKILSFKVSEAIRTLYGMDFPAGKIVFQKTNPEFEGDITLVVFPFLKLSKKSPGETAKQLGEFLREQSAEVDHFNVVKGFLNIVISKKFWLNCFSEITAVDYFGITPAGENAPLVMVEYCGPNTNKPLHLGHVRNILLGWSMIQLLEANGNKVVKANIVNDRGIHICKSMLAWKKWGNGETPESSGMKGDHLVGKYYVLFDTEYKKEIEFAHKQAWDVFCRIQKRNEVRKLREKGINEDNLRLILVAVLAVVFIGYLYHKEKKRQLELTESDLNIIEEKGVDTWMNEKEEIASFKEIPGLKEEIENTKSKYKLTGNDKKDFEELFEQIKNKLEIIREAHEMLRRWEAGDKDVRDLWKMMNSWVYKGFDETYKNLGVSFDKTYFESEMYKLGKKVVEENTGEGKAFQKRADGAVVIDMKAEKLDEKVLLRSDGTSVYITQDVGTAIQRIKDYPSLTKLIYTVGNEQEYHFKVLFKILKRLGYDWADQCYHLSYGMVELPEGKMKSREGTVVDADDLIKEMVDTSREMTRALGKIENFEGEEAEKLYHTIAMGALKYFILKVDPKKKMLFNPKESIDFNGNTGPFIQYTYARIQSVLRKAKDANEKRPFARLAEENLEAKELKIIKLIYDFPAAVKEAVAAYNPSVVANYIYELAKQYNQFYHDINILREEDEQKKNFRLVLSDKTAQVIKSAMGLLGIEVPERM